MENNKKIGSIYGLVLIIVVSLTLSSCFNGGYRYGGPVVYGGRYHYGYGYNRPYAYNYSKPHYRYDDRRSSYYDRHRGKPDYHSNRSYSNRKGGNGSRGNGRGRR